jgi:predicted ATPase
MATCRRRRERRYHAQTAGVTRAPTPRNVLKGFLKTRFGRAIEAACAAASRRTRYLFKHALVQDAAYGTLLRDSRRALHARIAETLESQFTEIAENQPELLARHCTEAGLIEKAAGLWSKAGQRSLSRSALVEAAEQLTRALDQIATFGRSRRPRHKIRQQGLQQELSPPASRQS